MLWLPSKEISTIYTIKPITDKQVFSMTIDMLTLPSVCVYAQQFFMAGFSFFIDRTVGQIFTLPIFSMTSALVEKLACYHVGLFSFSLEYLS